MRLPLPFLLVLPLILSRPASGQQAPTSDDGPVRRLLADYIELYRQDALEQWRSRFLPSFVVAFTNPDGTTTVRGLEDFYQSQKRRFDEGHVLSEVLENVAIDRRGRLASAWADFVFTMDGSSRRGRLVMLLMAERGEFRIHSLMFSYDSP